jgi:hypothetical protein
MRTAIHCKTNEEFIEVSKKLEVTWANERARNGILPYNDGTLIYPNSKKYGHTRTVQPGIEIISAKDYLADKVEPIVITDRTCVVCRTKEEYIAVAQSIGDPYEIAKKVLYQRDHVITLKEGLQGSYDFITSSSGAACWDHPVEASVYLAGLGITPAVCFLEGQLVTLKSKPFSQVLLVSETLQVINPPQFKATIVKGESVGRVLCFRTEKYELIDDMELSLKIKVDEESRNIL